MGAGRAVRAACLLLWLGAVPALGSDHPDPAPEEARASFAQAGALERAGRCEEAIAAYRSAGEQGYAEAAVLERIGFCHRVVAERADTPAARRLDHRLRAATALTRALRLDPRNTSALRNLGDLAASAGDARGALALYRHLDAIAPGDPTTLLRLGSAHAQLGEHDLALAQFRRAIRLVVEAESAGASGDQAGRDAVAFSHLGAAESLIALERRDEARRELSQVLAVTSDVEPGSSDTGLLRASTRARMLLGAIDE